MAENNLNSVSPGGTAATFHGETNDYYGTGISRRRAVIIFSIVSLALIMGGINSTIVAVSLPAIMTDLKTNLAFVGWVITGFQFSSCVCMPLIGKISDDWGRKNLFMFSIGLFTLSSLACGFAPNIFWLIVFRILQGVGGGAILPSATGIVSDTFGKYRATAIGLFASIFPIGGVIGPNVGGFLVDHLSWRWTFFVNIPFAVLLMILGIWLLPKSMPAKNKRALDLKGAGLFTAAILAILYAFTNWADNPQNPGFITWGLFVLGLIFIWLLVRQENRVQHPMIEMKLLKWRPFLAANLYHFVFGSAVFGIFTFIPYYAIVAYKMSGSESGLIVSPRSISAIVFAALTSIFIIRLRYRLPMIVSAIIMSAGFFLLSRGYHDITILGWQIQNVWLLAAIVMIGGIGMGISNPAANNAVLDLVPEKVAVVTGMRGTIRTLGGVLGTAIIVLLLSHYQDKAVGIQRIAFIWGILMLLIIPLPFLMPEMARKPRHNPKNIVDGQKVAP